MNATVITVIADVTESSGCNVTQFYQIKLNISPEGNLNEDLLLLSKILVDQTR